MKKLQDACKAALELAIKRAQWDYRTAEIAYNDRGDNLCWFLPLDLSDSKNTKVALLVTKERSGNYQGQTILPLSWAYNNVRLIARPYTNWLADVSDDDRLDGMEID